jgi:hypothetical protein
MPGLGPRQPANQVCITECVHGNGSPDPCLSPVSVTQSSHVQRWCPCMACTTIFFLKEVHGMYYYFFLKEVSEQAVGAIATQVHFDRPTV